MGDGARSSGGWLVKVLTNRTADDTVVVKLEGRFDRETVPDARKQLLRITRKRDAGHVDVDLAGVSAIDTAGLALLVELLILFSRKGREVRLKGANENIERMLHMACLDQLFKIQCPSDGEK
jgi:HptB-dependent secretion and biofilm anti anti-sigma factor